MRVVLFLCFIGLVVAENEGYNQAVSFCSDVCGACGAQGELADDVCVCRVDASERNDECLNVGKRRLEEFDMGWRIEEIRRQKRFLDAKDQPLPVLKPLRRPHRSAPNDVDFYGPPIFGQAGLRPHRSGLPAKSSVYEIVIGNENEDTVQLVFPQSENLAVQHQYLFEDDRGMNHPCSHVVSDMDLDFGIASVDDNSWERHPTGFEQPRRNNYDYSSEDQNFPIHGRNQDNLQSTRVDILDDFLQPNLGNTQSNFDQRARTVHSQEYSNENYSYEQNNVNYEDSFENHDTFMY